MQTNRERGPILWYAVIFALVITLVGSTIALTRAKGLLGFFRSDSENYCFTLGLASPSLPTVDKSVSDFTAASRGRNPDILLWYNDFRQYLDMNTIRALPENVTPLITWEPFDHTVAGVVQPEFALARIAEGAHDEYLLHWAQDLNDLGRTIILRFAHEANGNWYPWSEQVNGNSAGEYVQAWKHVREVFDKVGVPNVRWMWAPNVVYLGSTPISDIYPGDQLVDVVGIDGYNWGTSKTGKQWQSPTEIFSDTVAQVRELTDHRLMLSEVSSTESGGDKAQWMKEFSSYLQHTPEISGFIWFDFNKETDWRVTSSVSATIAYSDMVADLSSSSCFANNFN
ncbi:MAG: glycoside hydrolase family 26 protein [Mycobacteriaceae bacterium]